MRAGWGLVAIVAAILAACGGSDDDANLGAKIGPGGAAGAGAAGEGGSDASAGGSGGGAGVPSGGTAGSGGAAGSVTGGSGGDGGSAGSAGVAGAESDGGSVSPWVNGYGTSAADAAIALGTDAAGNVYVALGEQNGFDFGQGIVGGLVLVKLLPNGTLDWYVSIPTANFQGALAVDGSGNVVYMGSFNGGIVLGNTTIVGGTGLFAVRYSPNKTLLASKAWINPGPSAGGVVQSLTTDAAGSAIFALEMGQGSLDFGNGPVSGQSKTAIVKLDSNFTAQWTTQSTNVRVMNVRALANGDIDFIGWGYGTASFGGSSVNTTNGTNDFMIGRLSASGNQTLLKALGGTGNESTITGTAAPNGDFYVAGAITGTVDFGGGALTSTPTPPGPGDWFIAGFDATGAHAFSKFVAVGYEHYLTRVELGPTNRLHVAGQMSGMVDYGTGQLVSGGGLDALLLELSTTNGSALRARRWGADGIQVLVGVSPTANGDVVLAVNANGTLDLGDGPVTSFDGNDPFVALLPP